MEENKNHSKHNFKPIIIGFVLVVLVTALFFLKSSFDTKRKTNLNTQNSQDEARDLDRYASINSADLLKKLNSDDSFEILDIRDQESFLLGHIVDSRNMLPEDLIKNINIFDKNKQYYVVDDLGFTPSEKEVLNALIEADFQRVAYLEGGMYNWVNDFNPTVEFGNPKSIVDQAKVNYISSDDLKKILDEGGNDFLLVDVRASSDYATGHLKNAINIPLDNLETQRKDIPSYKKIILYDDNGVAAFQGAVRLFDVGVLNAFALSDGFNSWKNKGFEVVK